MVWYDCSAVPRESKIERKVKKEKPVSKSLAERISSLRIPQGPGADGEWEPGNESTLQAVLDIVAAYEKETANTVSFTLEAKDLQEAVDRVVGEVKDKLSPIEQSIVALATPLDNYGTIAEALAEMAAARKYQISQWKRVSGPDAGGRLPEEWLLLLNRYVAKANEVYTDADGSTAQGRIRVSKYAGILTNLAFWWLQA